MVTEPGIVSLAGGAYVSVWPADGADACTVDGYVDMPGRGRGDLPVDAREVRTGYGGGVTMTIGPGSAAVPGALAALDLAQARFGRLPWAEVVAPAEEVARAGFPLGSASGYYLPYVRDGAFGWDPETVRALRRPDGGWVGTGDRMLIDGLADTVRLIAEHGARDAVRRRAGRGGRRRHGRPRRPGDAPPTWRRTGRSCAPGSRCAPGGGSCAPTRHRRSAGRCSPRCSRCSATARRERGPRTTWPT